MGWSNKQYADWMISNRVKEQTMCLVEVGCKEGSDEYLPKSLYQISADGIRGNDLFAPFDGWFYRQMYYLKSKTDGEYIIGLSEVFEAKLRGESEAAAVKAINEKAFAKK